jgi:hypothetical protein
VGFGKLESVSSPGKCGGWGEWGPQRREGTPRPLTSRIIRVLYSGARVKEASPSLSGNDGDDSASGPLCALACQLGGPSLSPVPFQDGVAEFGRDPHPLSLLLLPL